MPKPTAKTTPSAASTKSPKRLPSGMKGTNQENHAATQSKLIAAPKRGVQEPVSSPMKPKFLHHPAGSSVEQKPEMITIEVNTGSGKVRVEGKPNA